GQANGSNPLAVIVPCHRVIGSNGRLTGYGGGEERKRWLLNFEQGVSDARALDRAHP
ncbi:MAG TPA: methylated-DNA--[protein]-cysteine S-methyltransferase, partial [Myxococcaceae bacterium]|nr:methylated-DNA--[protein]-cysteine S-methyltransferase [Myxococcaceae bacterium]